MSSQANIYIDKGTDFRVTIELFDEDDLDLPISNYTFYGDMRKLYSTKKAAEFDIQKSSNDITLVSSNKQVKNTLNTFFQIGTSLVAGEFN